MLPGDLGVGGGGGGKQGGDGDVLPGGAATASPIEAGAKTLARGGKLQLGPGDEGDLPDGPGVNTVSAASFAYDRTGLPRYPDDVQKVASAVSFPSRHTADQATGSGTVIVTTSRFSAVVEWYRSNLRGWQDSTIGDFGQLGRAGEQLTPDNIMKMLNGGSAVNAAPSAATDVIRLSILKPPADSSDPRAIMIVQKGDTPVQIMMQGLPAH